MKLFKHAGPVLLALAAINPVNAASLLVGGPGDPGTGDCASFGCGLEYQQVYGAGLFSGTVTITAITFFNNNFDPGSIAPANYVLSLSTTSAAVDGLSSVFADNLGLDNTLFFGGALGGLIGASNQFTIVGTPFVYDPTLGNLLIHLTSDGTGTEDSVYLDFVNGAATGTTGRAFGFSLTGFADSTEANAGLVTEFTFAGGDVPEPGTSVMMLLGGGAIVAMLRRKRAVSGN